MLKRPVVLFVLAMAILVLGAFAMHGRGHRLLARWMPAIHGNR